MKGSLFLLLAGVAAGLLLAPRKGSETWQLVMDKFDDLTAGVTDTSEDVEEAALT